MTSEENFILMAGLTYSYNSIPLSHFGGHIFAYNLLNNHATVKMNYMENSYTFIEWSKDDGYIITK